MTRSHFKILRRQNIVVSHLTAVKITSERNAQFDFSGTWSTLNIMMTMTVNEPKSITDHVQHLLRFPCAGDRQTSLFERDANTSETNAVLEHFIKNVEHREHKQF